MNLLTLFLVSGTLLLAGCVTRHSHDAVTMTSRTLGIDISSSPDSAIPHFRIGFITVQYHLTPTSSNKVFAPSVYSSIAVEQGGVSRTDIAEDFATGDAAEQLDINTAESPAKLKAKRPPVK